MKVLALACCCVDVYPQTGKIMPGGNALNLAVNCKLNGADVFVMGNIGTDNYGGIIKQAADKYKINRDYLYEVSGISANNIIHIDASGDRYFKEGAWTGGVWDKYKISERDKAFARTMDAVRTEVGEADFINIISLKKDGHGPLMSSDFYDNKITPEYEKYFPFLDLFFISGKEQDSPEFRKTLKDWSQKYKTIFTATLGESGSVSYKNGEEFICPAVKVAKVVDTTGCGDSYQAGFIMDYLKNKNILSAMQTGSQYASKTLAFMGGFEF